MARPSSVLKRVLGSVGTSGAPRILVLPCAFDGLSARQIEHAGFQAAFMSGFSVAAVHGVPDTGLLSLGEVTAAARRVCGATSLPCIVDGDTGFGNALNVKRTIRALGEAGAAAVMIEDQVSRLRPRARHGQAVC